MWLCMYAVKNSYGLSERETSPDSGQEVEHLVMPNEMWRVLRIMLPWVQFPQI